MALFDAFRLDGKRVLVVGGATGIGAASAEVALAAGVLAVSDFDEAAAWFVAHRKADYFLTKQAVCAYVATEAYPVATERPTS